MNLGSILAAHPWQEAERRLGRPIDSLWTFDLGASAEALWPHLIDTSAFNRRLGQSEMRFAESGGRLQGRSRSVGIELEWEEVPWEWAYLTGLSNARIYRRGFLRKVRSRYLLEPVSGERCRLHVYFGLIPRGPLGWLLGRLGLGPLRRSYGRALGELVAELAAGAAPGPGPAPPPAAASLAPRSPCDEAKLEKGRRELLALALPGDLVERLAALLRDGEDDALYRMQPRALARAWGAAERLPEMLRVFLHACRLGLLNLTWDLLCPHCRGVREEIPHLGALPEAARCDACDVDFLTSAADALEVTFHASPAVRAVEKRWYCSAEPATKRHIKLQQHLEPGEERVLRLPLPAGDYRLRVRGEAPGTLLQLTAGGAAAEVPWRGGGRTEGVEPDGGVEPLVRAPAPTLRLRNAAAEARTFVLEEIADREERLRPADLFGLQDFRDLFAEEAIAAGLKLDIGAQAILFTDIVGSTRFYYTEGDAYAFAEVRRHFVIAYEVVKGCGGVVVKTIGDAVMAAFSRPADALRAALALQARFPAGGLRLRVTLHVGPCLAVRLDSNLDYFGSTVNLAAKLQALAGAGEVVMSDAVRADPGIAQVLAERGLREEDLEPLIFPLRWTDGPIEIAAHRLRVS